MAQVILMGIYPRKRKQSQHRIPLILLDCCGGGRRGRRGVLVAFQRGHLVVVIVIFVAFVFALASETFEAAGAAELGEVDSTEVLACAFELDYVGKEQQSYGLLKKLRTASHTGHAAHATELRKVLFGGLVLLVLINPLVKVGLEEVQLLVLLKQAGPVFLLELLLLQLDLDVLGGVVDLAGLGVDLGEELELDVELAFEGAGRSREGQARGLEVELQAVLGDVGDGDGEVDEVLAGVGGGGALGPED